MGFIPFRPVSQAPKTSCGVMCVTMITGMDKEYIERLMLMEGAWDHMPDIKRYHSNNRKPSAYQLSIPLMHLGYDCSVDKIRTIRFIKNTAIIPVTGNHWAIATNVNGMTYIIDPLLPMPIPYNYEYSRRLSPYHHGIVIHNLTMSIFWRKQPIRPSTRQVTNDEHIDSVQTLVKDSA